MRQCGQQTFNSATLDSKVVKLLPHPRKVLKLNQSPVHIDHYISIDSLAIRLQVMALHSYLVFFFIK